MERGSLGLDLLAPAPDLTMVQVPLTAGFLSADLRGLHGLGQVTQTYRNPQGCADDNPDFAEQ